jgi:hypothetical protein
VLGEFNREVSLGRTFMKDIIFIAATLAFFAAAIGYVRFCDRIR